MKLAINTIWKIGSVILVSMLFYSATLAQGVSSPAFSPHAGTYVNIQTVAISTTTPGATILFTTDNSNPNSSHGIEYSGPLTISQNTTIKAFAYKTGMSNSETVSGDFSFQCAAPTIRSSAGTSSGEISIVITTVSSKAVIRYTTDGMSPTTSTGKIYTGPINITQNTLFKAIAFKTGWANSAVAIAAFTIPCAGPVFTPAPGAYNTPPTVTLSSATSGASFRFTTDGSIPTSTVGTVYSSEISVGSSATIKAIAYKIGLADSEVVSGTYTMLLPRVAAPVFSPPGGIYYSEQPVVIHTTTDGAVIRYTTDGTIPSQTHGVVYSSGLIAATNCVIKAIASKSGMSDSEISSAQYLLTCAAPVYSPPAGSYERPQTVTITSATDGSLIRYTTDGTAPDNSNSLVYSGPVHINSGLTLKAMAFKAGFGNSEVTDGIYYLGNNDSDGDGVIDAEDDYPADPLRALNNFFPAAGRGSLAFEDLWPSKGDYDLNDVVVDYSFKTITSGSNKLVETFATFLLRATGAALKNGFGFQLSGSSIPVTGITATGMKLTKDYITLNEGGTETNQSLPTFIVFDNAMDLLKHPGVGSGINTTPGAPFVSPVTIELHIVYTPDTYPGELLDIEHFNPFIIVNMIRKREVHLPDYPPTNLVDVNLFGTMDDNSSQVGNRYYKTRNNLPWAFNIYESFDYPIEKAAILGTYLHFGEWAQSSGNKYPNWYKDLAGYRNEDNIYQH
jgi:LruC domain-containing protein